MSDTPIYWQTVRESADGFSQLDDWGLELLTCTMELGDVLVQVARW